MIHVPTPEDVENAARSVGLSIAALCREAKVDPSTYFRWRTGHRNMGIETVRRMVQVIEQRSSNRTGEHQ